MKLPDNDSSLKSIQSQAIYLENLGANLAHELRTPLVAIKSGIKGAQEFLPQLIEAYRIAEEHNLVVPEIQPRHLDMLSKALASAEQELNFISFYINMLAMNLCKVENYTANLQTCSILKCIQSAFVNYPYRGAAQKQIAAVCCNFADFLFRGKEVLIEYVLFNMIKNAVYHIETAGKGKIEINTCEESAVNKLYFRDTGAGMKAEALASAFDQFYTSKKNNIGLGLFFCREVMRALQGDIVCQSEEGSYTEFILSFPKINQ